MNELNQGDGGATPLGFILLAVMISLTWFLPRRTALLPLLITTCYIPLGQSVVIAGANFPFFRFLLLVGWCRAFTRGETQGFVFTKMDKVFVFWLAVTFFIGLFTQPSDFFDRFISRCGEIYTAGGTYFLCRFWLRSVAELVGLVRSFALIIVPFTAAMIHERTTGHNLFAILGGVPEIAFLRDSTYRASGAFRNPLLAGAFGAALFPLFVGLYLQGPSFRRRALIGMTCTIIIAYTTASSGTVLALMGGIISLLVWRYRFSMMIFRRGIVLVIIVLAIVMKAPVWYIFSRVSEIAGGSGWYRSFLIEQAVNHFTQWCYTGSLYTANWAPGGETPAGNPNNTDIINMFVLEGLQGGLLKVILFTALIVIGFKNVGRFTRLQTDLPFSYRFMIWSLGACLLTHCLSFFSVTYFDQIIIMWYWLLAALAMLQSEYLLIVHIEPEREADS
ncbi:MAG TPA: hypothetical protein VGM64_03180 [Lacunisphaera sp.]|jgi:hypothetical protein